MFQRMRAAVRGAGGVDRRLVCGAHVDLTYGSDHEMEKAYRQYVSGWMFGTFGLRPALGRLLTEDDDLTPGGHSLRGALVRLLERAASGEIRRSIGRTFRMGNDVFEIVGVAEETFTGTETGTVTDVFIPMAMKNPQTLASFNNFWLRTLVQLKPGVAAEPVRERLRATFHAIQEERAKTFANLSRREAGAVLQGEAIAGAGGGGTVEPAAGLPARSDRSGRAGGAGAADRLRQRGQPDDSAGGGAGARNGAAGLDRRGAVAPGTTGDGRKRVAGVPGDGAWRGVRVVVRAVHRGDDQSADNPARLVIPADWRVLGFGLALAAG